MGTFMRAVVNGFGFSLGSALFRKVSERIGLEQQEKESAAPGEATAETEAETRVAGELEDLSPDAW